MDTEAQMRAARAEEAGEGAGGEGEPEELVPAEVSPEMLATLAEMVSTGGVALAVVRGGAEWSGVPGWMMQTRVSLSSHAHRAPPPPPQGFVAHRATRALYHSGGESLEAALGWLEEHGEEAGLDEPLLVPKVSAAAAPATPAVPAQRRHLLLSKTAPMPVPACTLRRASPSAS